MKNIFNYFISAGIFSSVAQTVKKIVNNSDEQKFIKNVKNTCVPATKLKNQKHYELVEVCLCTPL